MGLSRGLKAIFFDFDGTLAEDGDSIRQALNLACQVVRRRWPEIDTDQLAAIYRQESDMAWGDYDQHLRHLIEPEAMLASVWRAALAHWSLHDPNTERDAAAVYWNYRLQHCRPYSDVFPLLHDLSQHFHLCLLTNGAPGMQRAKVIASGLSSFFPHVFVGGDFPRGKPDQAIFHAALTAARSEPDQAVPVKRYRSKVIGFGISFSIASRIISVFTVVVEVEVDVVDVLVLVKQPNSMI